jgi:hypothetical protein
MGKIGENMRGACLCGNIEFELNGDAFQIYQCHCSLCRKQSGTVSNAATIVPGAHFRWLRGTEGITRWRKDSGFSSHFCSTCGSPVPNPLLDLPYYWVPAGLLDDDAQLKLIAQLHMASKAAWDVAEASGTHYEALPDDLVAFIAELQPRHIPS